MITEFAIILLDGNSGKSCVDWKTVKLCLFNAVK